MQRKEFSRQWKASTKKSKQRKYKYNAPLHLKQKMLHVHLSSLLRQKYGLRNIQLRTGDKVKVLRGQYKKKEGKVSKINLKREKIYVTGVEYLKKDGTKLPFALSPSHLIIQELELSDKLRKAKLESKKKGSSGASSGSHSEIKSETKTKTHENKSENKRGR